MSPGPRLCDRIAPLAGFAVGVTADRRSSEQVELLRRAGARVVHAPAMHTHALGDERPLRAATERIVADPPAIVMATTGIGVRGWFAEAQAWGLDGALLDALRRSRVHVRGPKALGAVVQAGLEVWRREDSERLDHMIDDLVEHEDLAGLHIALQLYGNDVPWAVARLTNAGARVTEVPVYRWTRPDNEDPVRRLLADILGGTVEAITFTSPPAVRSLVAIASEAGMLESILDAFATRVIAACVGPVTAEAAENLGISVGCAPDRGRLGLLVQSVSNALHAQHRHLASETGEVVVHGAVVRAPAETVELAGRERAVLEVLSRKPGTVVSRAALHRDVWANEGDEGAVDTTVHRLRRRVRDVGLVIATRPRRGFLLEAAARNCPASAVSQPAC